MNDFDFFAGRWNVANRRLVNGAWDEFPGHSVATRHFGGAASFDEITFPTKGFSGLTVRVYNPETRQWSIYWASSARGVLDTRPMVGAFEGNRGDFYGEETHEGKPVRCRFIWTVIDQDTARWEQAFSDEGQENWETNWIMDFTRA
ncbi:hypothetical protein EDD27_6228 [Nonomuraea polychroma]|uniref:DUF1579 domain-containing protein n=1 Tax=Nonomuraea polychroma TaxID=46176 RepID=A0A438MCN3_9ACTN|nr:hypothetical protein [Nonomuraea polychroma]RVX43543.1 hypothetical protein EDD27_6228 [Nonomuraea polychroma]